MGDEISGGYLDEMIDFKDNIVKDNITWHLIILHEKMNIARSKCFSRRCFKEVGKREKFGNFENWKHPSTAMEEEKPNRIVLR